jgi:anti-anti-sigma factor
MCRMELVVLPAVIDDAVLEGLRKDLIGRLRRTAMPVVRLDASHVERISSAGLGVLVAAALLAGQRGIRLEVAASSALFRESIALTGLARHLPMAEPALTG